MITIHSDPCGPIDSKTFSSECYFMTIIHDHSPFEICLLKNKDEVFEELKVLKKVNPQIKKIRCGNTKEYFTSDFVKFIILV